MPKKYYEPKKLMIQGNWFVKSRIGAWKNS